MGKPSAEQKLTSQKMPLHRVVQLIEASTRRRISLLAAGIRSGLPIPHLLVGDPGGGKTSIINAMCKRNGWKLVTRNAGMLLTEEFSGIPDFVREPNRTTTRWSVPELAAQLQALADERDEKDATKPRYEGIVLFLDDWHLAAHAIQSIGFELFTDYTMKGHTIPSNVQIVLAGNGTTASGAKSSLAAIINRVVKNYVQTDFDAWLSDFALPSGVHGAVIGFLMQESNRAEHFQGKESTTDAWASPRSWTNLSEALHIWEMEKIVDDVELMRRFRLDMYAGYVGTTAASAFWTFHEIYSKFDTEKPFVTGKVELPAVAEMVQRYAYVAALTEALYSKLLPMQRELDEHNSGKPIKDRKKLDVKSMPCIVYKHLLDELRKDNKELAMFSLRTVRARNEDVIRSLIANEVIDDSYFDGMREMRQLVGAS